MREIDKAEFLEVKVKVKRREEKEMRSRQDQHYQKQYKAISVAGYLLVKELPKNEGKS